MMHWWAQCKHSRPIIHWRGPQQSVRTGVRSYLIPTHPILSYATCDKFHTCVHIHLLKREGLMMLQMPLKSNTTLGNTSHVVSQMQVHIHIGAIKDWFRVKSYSQLTSLYHLFSLDLALPLDPNSQWREYPRTDFSPLPPPIPNPV